MKIDAIKQGTADLAQVALDDAAGATAFARGIGEVAAGARVHITNVA